MAASGLVDSRFRSRLYHVLISYHSLSPGVLKCVLTHLMYKLTEPVIYYLRNVLSVPGAWDIVILKCGKIHTPVSLLSLAL